MNKTSKSLSSNVTHEEFVTRNEFGKTYFETVCALGQLHIVKRLCDKLDPSQLVSAINHSTEKGYTALHHAAAWGQLEVIKLLLDLGAESMPVTVFGQTPRDLARKYQQTRCISIFDATDIRRNILDSLVSVRESITNPKKTKNAKYKPQTLSEINLALDKLEDLYDYDELLTFQEEIKELLETLTEPS